jgi:hypothetical protein
MRIGILSYPMLFQREGGLQAQVRATIRALNTASTNGGERLHVELADPCRTRLDEYDLVHVFGAGDGNERIVAAAAELQVPVVLSPLLGPGWSRARGARARVAGRLLGKFPDWNVQTSYVQVRRALQLATLVVALGEGERRAIASAFLVDPAKVRVVVHGVSEHFFQAGSELFRASTGNAAPFGLVLGDTVPAAAQALAELALPLVAIKAVRDDRMLASALAAAAVVVLPAHTGAVLEALASGTPVVMNKAVPLEVRNAACAVRLVGDGDVDAIKRAVNAFLDHPVARSAVRAVVREHAWDRVAANIASCYAEALGHQRLRTDSNSDL